MKNTGKVMLAAAIMMSFTMQLNAQSSDASANQAGKQQNSANSNPGKFVDKDNNGVCDNFESRTGQGKGANFVDKNSDGICDNRVNAGNKQGNNCRNGQGNQHRHGQGKGSGQGKCCRR